MALSETATRALHERVRANARRIAVEHLQATGRGEQARALLERAAPPATRARFATEAEMRLLLGSVGQARTRRVVAEQAAPPIAPPIAPPMATPAPEPTVEELAALNPEQWRSHIGEHWSAVFAAQDARRSGARG
jgi:hypothetical protein